MLNWRRKQVTPASQPIPHVHSATTKALSPLDEIIRVAGGHLLPDNFFTNVHIQERAAIRGRAPTRYMKTDLAAFLGTIIDTSYLPYRYSVIVDTDAAIRDQFKPDTFVTMEIAMEVGGGSVGVLWADENYQIVNTERFAMPGVRSVMCSVSAKQTHRLVFRNMAIGGLRSSFRVLRISAMVSD